MWWPVWISTQISSFYHFQLTVQCFFHSSMLYFLIKEHLTIPFYQTRRQLFNWPPEENTMSKYRETPCKFYICRGECSKGRAAEHKTYCQHCSKYYPRAKVRHINQKKRYNEQQRSQITAWNNTRKRILWIYQYFQQVILCDSNW